LTSGSRRLSSPGGLSLAEGPCEMASTIVRCYCLLLAIIAITTSHSAVALSSKELLLARATPWRPPFNAFADAPIHAHNWEPPQEPGAASPTIHPLPLHPSPYPFFHTLPYPLPRPLLCPRYGYPPHAVIQHGRLPPTQSQSLYFPLPLLPHTPHKFRCYPLPLPFPLPYEGAPPPQ
jgi:hypothetical protein